MMLVPGMLLGGRMVMSHESHHQDMGEWAEKNHAVKQYIVERDLEDGHQQNPHHRD
jgi:hypothetical protein